MYGQPSAVARTIPFYGPIYPNLVVGSEPPGSEEGTQGIASTLTRYTVSGPATGL